MMGDVENIAADRDRYGDAGYRRQLVRLLQKEDLRMIDSIDSNID